MSGPAGQGGGLPTNPARPVPAPDPHRPIKAFLEEHQTLFGYGKDAIEKSRLKRESVTPRSGMRTLVWQQEMDGLEVYEAVLIGHISREGELISLAAQFVPQLGQALRPGQGQPRAARLTPREAVLISLPLVGEEVPPGGVVALDGKGVGPDQRQRFRADGLPGDAEVRLVWLPLQDNQVNLCWQVELTRRAGGERFRLLLDAESGEVLLRRCLTLYASPVEYRVFTSDSPAPFSPGHPIPSTNQAPVVARSLLSLTALSTNASPTGWIHDAENETRGNNVEAHLDRDGNNEPDLPRPQGFPPRVFDFPLDLGQPPSSYAQASVVQFFYWCNWMHDRLYELGFNEAAGNFQKDNFGRGGLGSDPILADAQDGSGFNNANYTQVPDGLPGRIQMFLFNGPDPDRDGSLDAEIILHEYTHGLTDRLVGGGVGLSALQSIGLAEGWSDFYALAMLSESNDDPAGVYPTGGYSTFQFKGLRENYYFGIRRYPYSTDLTKNPLTFKDLDPAQASSHPGVPRNPIFNFDPRNAAEVHAQGEVWCAILWDVRAGLVDKHGFEAGSQLALQIITDGLKLSPPNPNFIQARDAILLADRVDTGGQNQFELWAAFAKRGLGVSASSPPSWTTQGVTEAFDRPDLLTVTPYTAQVFTGLPGGPIQPLCRELTLANPSEGSLAWAAAFTQPWLSLEPSVGILPPGGSTNLALCLSSNALLLPAGWHSDAIILSNLNTGAVLSRSAQIRILEVAAMPFLEDFESGQIQPWWTVSGEGFPRTLVTTDLEPYRGSYHLTMDSGFDGVYGRNEATLAVDLDGYTNVVLRFWMRSFQDDFDAPPSGPFEEGANFDGLAVSADGFTWFPVGGFPRLAGGYSEVVFNLDETLARFGLAYNAAFRIRFNQYDNNAIPNDGVAIDDLSITGIATKRFTVSVAGPAREGLAPGFVEGEVRLPVPVSVPTLVQLTSADPAQLTVPPEVLIPSGQASVSFPVTVVDDSLLDGLQSVLVTVSAPGFIAGQTSVPVHDNESAELVVAVPARVQEGQGTLSSAGRLWVNTAPSHNIPVHLASDDPDEVAVPEVVVLPAGQTEVTFDLEVGNDDAIDGPQTVLVLAWVENWEGDMDVLTVLDNELTNLFLSVPALLHEGDWTLPSAGQLSISGVLNTNLAVELSSSDPTRVSVPRSVIIPAGASSVPVSLQLHDDSALVGSGSVFLTARAPGFVDGTAGLRLLDDEIPPAPFNPRPPHLSTNNPLVLELGWSLGAESLIRNGDFETGDLSGWVVQPGLNGAFVINDGTVDPLGPEAPSAPFAGRFSALTQQIGPGRQTLSQVLSLPKFADRVWLSWMDRVNNHAPAFASNHCFRVEIQNLVGATLAMPYSTAPGHPLLNPWSQHSLDLTPWSGQYIRLVFVEEDRDGFLNVHVDQVQVEVGYDRVTVSEVYLGDRPELGPETFQGLTTNETWSVSGLAQDRAYFWRVVASRGAEQRSGPVWQFRTRGVGALDHFTWEPIPRAQALDVPFPVTLTARDNLGNVVSQFQGGADLSAVRDEPSSPVQVLIFDAFAESTQKYRRTLGAIHASYTNVVETNTAVTDPSILRSQLTGKDVFLIMEQRLGSSGQLANLGTAWGPVLHEFVSKGGVVVACSYSKDEHLILKNGGLLSLNKVRAEKSVLAGRAAEGALAQGVPESFPAYEVALYEPPEEGTVWLTGGSNLVLAASRAIDDGLVVMIGTGYVTNRTGLDPFLANVVRWPRRFDTAPVAVSPGVSGYFDKGRWSGSMTVHETGSAVRLLAQTAEGIRGESEPVEVQTTNDLVLAAVDFPDPIEIGALLQLGLTLNNSGPGAATGVILTNVLPPGLTYVRATPSQGTCALVNGAVRCDLGVLPGGSAATINLELVPNQAGYITNVAEAFGNGEELYVANNRATTVTRVNFATLSLGSVIVTEGQTGGVTAEIPVWLTPANNLEVRCDFTTSNNTALAGSDYLPVAGTLAFPPGVTNQTIRVPILSDDLNESTETLIVALLNPVQSILLQSSVGCLILDDDPMPLLAIGDAAVQEGPEESTTSILFPVSLSHPSGQQVTVDYATVETTASPGKDYVPVGGTLMIPAGVTNLVLAVPVLGDRLPEADETVSVRLRNPFGAILEDGEGVGTIEDDDTAQLDHFSWSTIESPQFLNAPFQVVISARDNLENLVPGFGGPVVLNGLSEAREIELGEVEQTVPEPMGASYHDQRLQAIYLAEELGGPGRITSLALFVESLPGQRLQSWTIRMKHTSLTQYVQPAWEPDGWTLVYQRNDLITTPGWVWFRFSTPFVYNGTDQLMVDFSFNNATYSADGRCGHASTSQPRSLHFRTDSGFGNPLLWEGPLSPPPDVSRQVPVLRLQTEIPVTLSPTLATHFVSGVWTGMVRIAQSAARVSLRATDAEGHTGLGNEFSVAASDDLALSVAVAPEPVRFDGEVTYTLRVTNTGPAAASQVIVSNRFAPSLRFLAASLSQGVCQFQDGTLVCQLGTLPSEAEASISIQALSRSLGLITNRAHVTRFEPEAYLVNNTVETVSPAQPPSVWVNDVTVVEEDTTTNAAVFSVWLSNPTDRVVSIPYAATGLTASNFLDLIPVEGVLMFAPGATNLQVTVPVRGDLRDELDETFALNLLTPTNAVLGRSQGIATIQDNDPFPLLSIADVVQAEGDTGPTNFQVRVSLSEASGKSVRVFYATSNGTALAGIDYNSGSALLLFPPGITNRILYPGVLTDREIEPDETFVIRIFNPSNAVVEKALASVTIRNDDGLPGVVDHFVWSPIGPVQLLDQPFPVLVTARDFYDNTVTNFDGFAQFHGREGARDRTLAGEERSWEFPLATGYHDARSQVIYLASELGGPQWVRGLALDLALTPGQVMNRFTIRMRHTPLSRYQVPAWEEIGWTTVYQTNQNILSEGWTEFHFQTPFRYDGTNHLMVDFSFNNSHFTSDGLIRATTTNVLRALNFRTDSAWGDPLLWAGSAAPAPVPSSVLPKTRFLLGRDLPIQPAYTVPFLHGTWSGLVTVQAASTNMVLLAEDASGRFGTTQPFIVLGGLEEDSDSDGLPDAWELHFFGSLDHPDGEPGLDPDGDGAVNLAEAQAGTDPRDPASVFILTLLEVAGADVRIVFTAVPGRRYQVERTGQFAANSWAPVGNPVVGTGSTVTVLDGGAAGQGHWFYRVCLLPPAP